MQADEGGNIMKKQKFLRFCRMSCLLVCKRSRMRAGRGPAPRRALRSSVFGLAGAAAPLADARALCGCKSRPPEAKRSFLPSQEILRLRCAPLRMTERGASSGGWKGAEGMQNQGFPGEGGERDAESGISAGRERNKKDGASAVRRAPRLFYRRLCFYSLPASFL